MTGCKDETLSSSECCCQHAPDLIAPIVSPIVKEREEKARIAAMERQTMVEVQGVFIALTLTHETRTRCVKRGLLGFLFCDYIEEPKWVIAARNGRLGDRAWRHLWETKERVYANFDYDSALADYDFMVKKYGLKTQREPEEIEVEEKMRQYRVTGPVD